MLRLFDACHPAVAGAGVSWCRATSTLPTRVLVLQPGVPDLGVAGPDQGDYLHHSGQYPELVTVRLRPMTASEISAFTQHQQGKYVADRVAAGETPAHAQEQADQQWERYFPARGAADGHRCSNLAYVSSLRRNAAASSGGVGLM